MQHRYNRSNRYGTVKRVTPHKDDDDLAHSAHSGEESQDAEAHEIWSECRGRHLAAQQEAVDGERQPPPNAKSPLTEPFFYSSILVAVLHVQGPDSYAFIGFNRIYRP